MSKTIDERVVQMQLQNESFERNANKSIKTLDKLDKALNLKNGRKSFDEVEAAAEKTNFKSLLSAVEQVNSKFTTLGILGVTTLAKIANQAVNCGATLLKSLTISPISQGYEEYELKMGSIQTILASTGESLDTVKNYLEELNVYADRTIYSFSDMTQNIGKFTNAGVKLKDAVAAIKGVSNVAAVSGANANEASRAMYNFAQALSAGYVKLIDWKSIENANMATVEFKQQLIDTALKLGTVTKEADGMYKTISGKTFNATRNFNEVLQEQWMTTDVLVETLGNYADETTDIGKKAYDAATKVRTFSKLLDTLKEAVGSGWSMTSEYLIGDYDQAAEVWTKVNDTLSEIINKSSDVRNSLLKVWNEGLVNDDGHLMRTWNTVEGYWSHITGRQAVIQGFSNIFKTTSDVINVLGSSFDSVFRKINGQDLIQASYKFLSFSRTLKLSNKQLESLKSGFTGIFSIVKKFTSIIGSAIKSFSPVTRLVSYIGKDLLSAFGKIGEELSKISKLDSYKDLFNFIESSLDSIVDKLLLASDAVKKFFKNNFSNIKIPDLSSFLNIFDKFGGIYGGISSVGQIISGIFSEIGKSLSNAFSGFKFENLISLFNSGFFATFVIQFTGLVDAIKDSLDSLSKSVSGGGVLGILRDTLKSFQTQIKAKSLIEIAVAVGILATSLTLLSLIKPERLAVSVISLSAALFGFLKVVSTLGSIMSGEYFRGFGKLALSLIPMSISILIFSSAVVKLSDLNWNGLLKGLTGLAAIAAILSKTANYLNSSAKKLKISAIGFIGLAAAVVILSSAVAKIGNLDIAQLLKGLIGVAGSLAAIAAFTKISDLDKIGIKTGISLIAIATSMNIFASSISKIGTMNLSTILKGVVTIGSILGIIAGFLTITNKINSGNIISMSTSLLIISGAMQVLGNALGNIGGMGLSQIGKGLLGMAGSLTVLAIAMAAFSKVKSGAGAMILASSALIVLTPALLVLGSMSLSQIGIGLLAIAGAFTILGVAGLLLKPLAPTILILSGALALMGVGIFATGSGIMILAAGITALAASFAAGGAIIVSGITAIISGIATMIPTVMSALASGIVQFASVISQGAPVIASAVVAIIMSIIITIRTTIPAVVTTGLELILALLQGISSNIGAIAVTAISIVVNFINAISTCLDMIVEAGINLAISFINGLANGIRNNSESVMSAVMNLVSSIIELVLTGLQTIVELIPGIGSTLSNGLETAKNAVRETLAPDSMEQIGVEAANGLSKGTIDGLNIETLGTGISQQIEKSVAGIDVTTSGTEIGNKFTESVNSSMISSQNLYKTTSSGKTLTNEANSGAQSVDTTVSGAYIVQGVVAGINNNAWQARNAAANLARECANAINSSLQINSPSKVTYHSGVWMVKGLANAVRDKTKMAIYSTVRMVHEVVSILNKAVATETVDSPSIVPVLDMTEIYSQIDGIGDDAEWRPVIRPILDMTGVNPGLDNLNAIVRGRAQTEMDSLNQNGSESAAQNTWAPTFNQYNYSPKPLSRIEIYRQTNNQFSMLKGVMKR